jgi:hypothetical protein
MTTLRRAARVLLAAAVAIVLSGCAALDQHRAERAQARIVSAASQGEPLGSAMNTEALMFLFYSRYMAECGSAARLGRSNAEAGAIITDLAATLSRACRHLNQGVIDFTRTEHHSSVCR